VLPIGVAKGSPCFLVDFGQDQIFYYLVLGFHLFFSRLKTQLPFVDACGSLEFSGVLVLVDIFLVTFGFKADVLKSIDSHISNGVALGL
jgi:hypothetical protein